MKRIAAVTGANSGIGKEVCRGLLNADFHVLMLCRNHEKAESAKTDLLHEVGHGKIDIIIVDLASLKDIVRAVNEIHQSYNRLDILVNNAGLFSGTFKKSADGYELTFAVNHLAVQLLTDGLLPLLKAAAQPERPARIVNVASEAHRRGKLHLDDLQLKQSYSGMSAYSQSKLANILHAAALATRLSRDNILINACHPGVVATNFASGEGGVFGFVFKLFKWAMITPERGAETPLFLAIGDLPEPSFGRYYDKCRPRNPTALAQDGEQAQKLIELSQELIDAVLAE